MASTEAPSRAPNTFRAGPDGRGRFGIYGGRFVAETLMPLILDLEAAYDAAKADPAFHEEMAYWRKHYIGRPSPLYLARRVTEWSSGLQDPTRRFVVCTGGGPGMMEAANRGAQEAGGKSVGLNIGLPFEQLPNPHITPELSFQFHYFFMRKFWFAYLAKAMVFFPGGFGTLDELMEVLTLVQTRKINKRIVILLYGSAFWKEIVNFDALVRCRTISPEDLELFQYADDPDTAFRLLEEGLTKYYLRPPSPPPEAARPEFPEL